ncbi:MAG: hypothetical protein LAQ30_16835 [Acidobacteriia bacterium]|nr:hypothetical protein [Terriglobia bacterium]
MSSALKTITTALEQLGIPFLIGGSVASSAWGVGRQTFDVDIVARIAPPQVDPLRAALGKDWYVDSETARTGIPAGRSFNVIHMLSGDKFDIFPAIGEFHAIQLERARAMPLEIGGEAVECPVSTAEDILLAKLQWYRSGGEISERQWQDIQGILDQNPDFDLTYARSWAARLRIDDLLERALAEAGLRPDAR